MNWKWTYSVSIDRKDILIEGRINSNDVPHLMIDLQLQRGHWRVKVYPVQIMKEENLTVSFAAISRLRTLSGFADLDDDHITIRTR